MSTSPPTQDDPAAAAPDEPERAPGAVRGGTLDRRSELMREPANDPDRIRGEALRRSLYYTFVAWIPGAFWFGATNGAAAIELARSLGANDFVFALMSAAPLLGVVLQVPGSVVVERLGRRKFFFLWNAVPSRAAFVLIGLLPWIAPR